MIERIYCGVLGYPGSASPPPRFDDRSFGVIDVDAVYSKVDRAAAAREFIMAWEALRDLLGSVAALRDPRLIAARNRYRLSRGESTIGSLH